tara:strand:+ start:546 stop:1526 length:981 start_codon:yes stop_codon:yes gene_type:complete
MSLELSGTTGVKGVAGSVSAPSITGDDANTGISFPAADTIKFSAGGVEKLAITPSGLSGDGSGLTGVSSVGGATGVDFNDDVKARFGTGNDLEIYHDGNDSIINDAGDGDLKLQRGGSTKFITTSTGARVENTSSPLTSANSSGNDFVVTGDGAMGITLHTTSTSSNCAILFADGTSGSDTYRGSVIYRHLHDQLRFNVNGGTLAQQINSDLTVSFQNTVYATVSSGSDISLKSNLVRFTGALEKVKQIVGYQFDIKCGDKGSQTKKSGGVVAQDVEKVYPDLVEEKDGIKHLEYSSLIGVLVEAVKELTTKVETLETKIAALEAA